MSILVNIYRRIVPEKFRYKVLNYRKGRKLDQIRRAILNFYKQHPSDDAELNEGLAFLRENPLAIFPYNFSKKYEAEAIEVFTDEISQLNYVLFKTHKLYFKRGLSIGQIKSAYSFLLCEQDPDSPHCYLTGDFKMKPGAVLADVGCAEGIFTLMTIDRIDKAILFEADKDWVEALEHTFKPWKEKITIVSKFVADKTDDQFVSLDDYFKNAKPDFLKIDVDGAEDDLLKGARQLISGAKLQIALCTYHKQQDAEKFNALLKGMNYTTSFSKNYMLFFLMSRLARLISGKPC